MEISEKPQRTLTVEDRRKFPVERVDRVSSCGKYVQKYSVVNIACNLITSEHCENSLTKVGQRLPYILYKITSRIESFVTLQSCMKLISATMAVRLRRDDLPELIDVFKPDFPASLPIIGSLSNLYEHKTDTSEIFVDKWPHPKAVFIKPTAGPQQVPTLDPEHKLFALDNQSAEDLLTKLRVFHSRTTIHFSDAPDRIWPAIEGGAKQHGYQTDTVTDRASLFYLPDRRTLPPKPALPEGYRLDSLRPCDAELVNSLWPHNWGEKTKCYVENLIRTYPSSAIFHSNSSSPVAFAMCYEDKAVGNLYVSPDHRRKGLAIFLMCEQIRRLYKPDETPFIYIYGGNVQSEKLNTKLGFVRTSVLISWVQCLAT